MRIVSPIPERRHFRVSVSVAGEATLSADLATVDRSVVFPVLIEDVSRGGLRILLTAEEFLSRRIVPGRSIRARFRAEGELRVVAARVVWTHSLAGGKVALGLRLESEQEELHRSFVDWIAGLGGESWAC